MKTTAFFKKILRTKKNAFAKWKAAEYCRTPHADEIIYNEQRLPGSYANFYIANKSVIVPTFRSDKDEKLWRLSVNVFPVVKPSA